MEMTLPIAITIFSSFCCFIGSKIIRYFTAIKDEINNYAKEKNVYEIESENDKNE